MATEFVDLEKYKISRYDEEKNKYFYYQDDFKWHFSINGEIYDELIKWYYDKMNKLHRLLIMSEIQEVSGFWVPLKMEMTNVQTEHKTVLGNIILPLQLKKIPKEEATSTALKLLDEFKLGSIANLYPNALSGGMRQRVALLRTYLLGHSVFLLDEAFSALDELTRQDLYHWYLESKERLGLTTLVITHSIEEALTLSDRVYILNHNPGEIIADLPLKWDPATDRDWQQLQYKKRIIELLAEFH